MILRVVSSFGPLGVFGSPTFGFRRFGVPIGGAMDQASLHQANELVGNPPGDPCFELALGSAVFESTEDGRIAVTGAVRSVERDGEQIRGAAFSVRAGQTISVSVSNRGARLYVSAGPWHDSWPVQAEPTPSMQTDVLHVVPGPQAAVASLPERLVITPLADRVGIRCEPIGVTHHLELPSEPACVGAIQLTPDGTPIILGPDGPTIGGYPKIAVVCTSDLDKLGQLRPGQSVRIVAAASRIQSRH